jgi:diaminopimelate decarboxylase
MKLEPLSSVVTEKQVREIAEEFGTPVYVYSEELLEEQADSALAFPNAFGLTVRYAMKANPNRNILRLFRNKGIHIDASSGLEVRRALGAKFSPSEILLTAQEIPSDLETLVKMGVNYNACSLHQLATYGKSFQNSDVSVRINPGLGSGGTNRTNTGGPASSFGIWHEQFDEIMKITDRYNLNMVRVHTHIGSGSDPEVWKKVAGMSLGITKRFIGNGHKVHTLNLGGGYKVRRMDYEKSTDLQECGEPVKQAFEEFAETTGKKLRLEIEPGTFLVANGGCIIAENIDMVSTPVYDFLKTDSGMTENSRISLYGAQHPIAIVPKNNEMGTKEYIVSGHCCESGDILTPVDGNSEALQLRTLLESRRGDLVVIGGCGAYCSSMSMSNYNSFLEAPEVLIRRNGRFDEIRKRQTFEQLTQNEVWAIDYFRI